MRVGAVAVAEDGDAGSTAEVAAKEGGVAGDAAAVGEVGVTFVLANPPREAEAGGFV